MRRFTFPESRSIDDIISEIELLDKSNFNNKIIFCLAVAKEKEILKPCIAQIEFLPVDKEPYDEVEYNYEDFMIMRKSLSYDEIKTILDKIRVGMAIGIKRAENCLIKADSWDKYYIPSNQPWDQIKQEFPSIFYKGRLLPETSASVPYYTLAGNNNPVYSTGVKAIVHLFGLRSHLVNLDQSFLIIIPDYRARIKSVKIANKQIFAEIESKNIEQQKLRVSFYVASADSIVTQYPKRIQNNQAGISFALEPEEIVVVLSTANGEILDKKEINLKYRREDANVIIETPEYSLKEIIASGEGKYVEFKSELGNPEPFVRSVVAFGNTEGGRIFVGVNDMGKIVSVKEPEKIKTTIMNWIASYCDPKIDVNISYSNEMKIVVVEVPEGNQKPYFLKDEGVFIRHGATNRHASKSEWEQMLPQTRDSRRSTVGY